jgi:hypothetical protein
MIMCRRSMATYNTMGSGVSTTRRTIFQIDDSFIESNLPHEADLLRNIGDHRYADWSLRCTLPPNWSVN